jgi:hypothetical protein
MSRSLWFAAMLAPLAIACGGDGGGAGPDAGSDQVDSGVPTVVEPSNRFSFAAEDWRVPASGFDEGYAQPSSSAAYRYWGTLDVDGDRRPDIVHTGATDQSESAWDAGGSPFWKLYRGSADGWSADMVKWKVPPSGETGFYSLGLPGGGWNTFDITGDGLLDLVQTADPATGMVWGNGEDPHWKVFENDGDGGFILPERMWPVPDSGTSYGFSVFQWSSAPGFWTTMDIDGDRRPDLVQTADPATSAVWDEAGSPHWRVFANTGDGFDRDPTLWSVPPSGTTGGFYCWFADSTAHWRVLDLDGDGRADLVQTSDPATGAVWDPAGAPYWKLFAGGPEGFSASGSQWSVPPNGLGEGFFDAFWSASYRWWWLIDIDGDRDLDLVQTGDSAQDHRVWDAAGDPYWKVWRNDGARFSAELHRWAVPKSGTEEGFYLVASLNGGSSWSLMDADADGRLDLVQTGDPSTGRVWDAAGSPYWKVFLGEE